MSVQNTTEPDDVNVGLVATVTLVGAFLVLAIALALTALVRSESTNRGNEAGAYSDLGTVHRLKAEQRAKLEASPAWLDRAKGEVALPIERAMEMVTADIQKDPGRATAIAVREFAALRRWCDIFIAGRSAWPLSPRRRRSRCRRRSLF